MAANNSNTFEQVFNVQEDDNLTSRVAIVVCALVQRGIFVAGFSINKELLTIHYTGYNRNKPVWDLDFFEYLLTQDPLLSVREKIKGLFICNEKYLVVPEALYDEKESRSWLRQMHYIEAKEAIEVTQLEEDKAKYMHALPLSITELLKINFRKAPVQPLAAYQFKHNRQQSLILQCCLSGDQVCATLHNYSQLLWHRVFNYTSAEDIAYEIKHLCMEANISPSKLTLLCNALSAAEFHAINELSQYFPGMKSGNGRTMSGQWDAPISLAHQLLECV